MPTPNQSNTTPSAHEAKRVLAISSGGGHWIELLRLAPAFEGHKVTWVTVHPQYRADLPPGSRFHTVVDATRWDKLAMAKLVVELLWFLVRERPQVIVSTGAAPGYFAIRLGRLLRARTVWVDSFANADELSLSGQKVGPHADLWLTQWPELAGEGGPEYAGSVL